MTSLLFFFFQAEDGIRDLVRSRGLGDVYKRQCPMTRAVCMASDDPQIVHGDTSSLPRERHGARHTFTGRGCDAEPVSYTHLTLPTSDLV